MSDFLDTLTTATVTTDAPGGLGLEEYAREISSDETLAVSVSENVGFVVRLEVAASFGE